MKKVLQIALAVGFGFLAVTGGAAVQAAECTIENTGPGSNNQCTNNTSEICEVQNNTVISVNNVNGQTSSTGQTVVVGNTSGGNASSGNANNNNSASFTGTVVNGACVPAAAVATPTPPAGGRGGVDTPAAASTTPAPVAALPKTSGTSPLAAIGVVAAVSAVAAIVARSASFAYSRIKG